MGMTRDLSQEHYLNKADLARYFGISKQKANQLFAWADQIDDQELNVYRLYPNKVRKSVACRVLQIDMASQDEKMRTLYQSNPQVNE